MFELASGQAAVVIGDVCGKGPEAAAVTALARHTLRASLRRGAGSSGSLTGLNDAILAEDCDRFCSAAVAVLSPLDAGFELEVSLAGHPAPLRCTPAPATVSQVGVYGRLAGTEAFEEPSPVTEVMNPGDAVLLYTDGVTDVPPPNGMAEDELRVVFAEAVASTSTSAETVRSLQTTLDAVLPFDQRPDDIAIVVLRCPEARG